VTTLQDKLDAGFIKLQERRNEIETLRLHKLNTQALLTLTMALKTRKETLISPNSNDTTRDSDVAAINAQISAIKSMLETGDASSEAGGDTGGA